MSLVRLSERGARMPPSPIRKLVPLADAAKKRGVSVYHLNIGQPDIETPRELLAAVGACPDKVLGYGPSGGLAELRLAIKDYFADRGLEVGIDDIWVTTGGSEAISFALMTVCDPGDEVVVFEPFYTNYNGFAVATSVRLVPVATSVRDGFRLPGRAQILEKISPRTRAMIICSPNNPTGTVYTPEELFVISKICRERNLFLISDEVYREFVYDGLTHMSALALPDLEDRVIVVDSISKRFSACGARVGYLVSRNRGVMATVLKFAQARLCPPTLEQYGAIAAFKHMHKYVPAMIREYQRRRDVLCEGLSRIDGVELHRPEGAFYMMPRLPIPDTEDFARWLLEEFAVDSRTVMVAPAAGFYATPNRGLDEVRIAYVLEEASLVDAVRILGRAIAEYRPR